jgi:hypothetical protein
MKAVSILFVSALLTLASCSNNTSTEQPVAVELLQQNKINKGNIQAFNGKFLCTESDRNIIANRDVAQGWELFIFNWVENNEVSITSYDDYLLSADLSMNGEVTATRKEKGEWEIFKIEFLENGFIAIKASNGKYLTVDSSTLKINASVEKIGEKERFKLVAVN